MPKHRILDLRRESKEQSLSMNVLLNHIVEDYFEFASIAKKAGMMPFSKKLIQVVMNQLEEKEIIRLAKRAATTDVPDLVYMKRNKFTIETFLDTMLAWVRYSGFNYRDTYDDDVRTISLQHNMGSKWSTFLIGVLEITFNRLGAIVSFERPDDMVIMHIRTRQH